MITPGGGAVYRDLFARPHTPVIRVEVWREGRRLAVLPELLGGEVKATLGSQVTRTGSLSVPRELYPDDPDALLSPFGSRLRILRGIRAGDGREILFPVFAGLITDAELQPRRPCVIKFSDRATEVADAAFEIPEETRPGQPIAAEIRRLIREGVPDATFGRSDPIAAVAAAQVFDDDRARACDELAEAGGAYWYALPDGAFVIRRVPWAWHPAATSDGRVPVVAWYSDGSDGRPGVVEADGTTERMSRLGVYNAIVADADQADGQTPVREIVRDNDPDSPARYGSAFGRRVLHIDVPSGATAGAVRAAAATTLRRSRSSAEPVTWSQVPDPALELGDVAAVVLRGRARALAVAEITMPLVEQGAMSCTGRPIVLPSGVIARVE